MTGHVAARLLAWAIALALVALPMVGVLNGWFASERWPLTKMSVRAEFNHVSAEQIRAAAQPQLGPGFFAIRLDSVRAAVAALPWVERVEVRKRWPDRIDLIVHEQQPYAHWGEDRLVNRQGEIFRGPGANDLLALPRLAGPDERVGEVLKFHARCVREFSAGDLAIEAVTLSPRGGWRLDLASGTVIEVGKANAQAELKRFLDVWPRLAGSQSGQPMRIDLRYENGFAVAWAAVPAPAPAGMGHSGSEFREKQAAASAAAWPFLSPDRAVAAFSGYPRPALQSRPSRIPNPASPIPAFL